MKRTLAALASLPLAASLLLAAAPAHADDDVTCRGTIGARSIDGDVVVPKGAKCTLKGTRIDGDIKVGRNATLVARGVKVDGNIQAKRHKKVTVATLNGKRSTVDGNIQLERGGGGKIGAVVVDGDIQLFSNRGKFNVLKNVVDGNIQCKSNKPAPVGHSNRVEGNKEDQCRRL